VRVQAAIALEERQGWRFALFVRLLALALVAAWLASTIPFPRVAWWLGLIALFALSGLVPYLMRGRRRWRWWVACFVAVDAVLLTVALLAPNPFLELAWPIQMTLRLHNNLYLFVFLAGAALSYAPLMVLWTGAAVAGAWSLGVWLIAMRPETVGWTVSAPIDTAEGLAQARDSYLQPTFVDVNRWVNEVVLLGIAALVIAAAVWRARRLLARQVSAERARANLARYFSPDTVERLARDRGQLDQAELRDAAVLFVDIVGFTRLCEELQPERCIALLRSFHARMARCVFDHGGTLDKYIGDGIMATFGTLEPRPDDAARALACAGAMLDEVERWNAKRAARGAAAIRVGVGLHYGPVTVGNVGGDRQLEFTAIGDTVNVASRLERLTRELGSPLAVSGALATAAGGTADPGGAAAALLDRLRPAGDTRLRGRAGSIPTLALGATAGADAPGADRAVDDDDPGALPAAGMERPAPAYR
jgi:adenylate cyclase